jgi:predicted RNase H-like HicB family nuclease
MNKDRYSTIVCWDEEDSCFIATCLEFPLLSAFGDTREEAVTEFQVVLEMAIESYQEDNLELPKPKTTASHSGQFRLRLPKSLHRVLAETAVREGVSLNTYAVSLIAENNALKTAYTIKIETLERIVQQLASTMASQHRELQVHTQRLHFIEAATNQPKPTASGWQANPIFKVVKKVPMHS